VIAKSEAVLRRIAPPAKPLPPCAFSAIMTLQ
jgi:hypothetical protein